VSATQERRRGAERAGSALPSARPVKNPLSLIRVDSAVARSAAGFGVAFGLQSIPPMLDQLPNTHPAWNIVILSSLTLSLLGAVLASVVRRHVRLVNAIFAFVYLVAILTWPFAVLDVSIVRLDSPWLYYLMTIATAMAAIAFEIRIAALYLVLLPIIYAVIRITPAGGDVGPTRAVLDSVFALILGGVITIIFTILRTAAISVDRAQQTALDRYSHAVRQHAIEAERVQVDAIVHDSVLTTLLSAARAFSDEAKELAATMAGNAIGYLRDAVAVAPDADVAVPVGTVVSRIADAASTMSQPIEVQSTRVGRRTIPLAVAEALYSAAVQAMVNSLQHGGPAVRRWVEVRGVAHDAVEVEVGDEGAGFDPTAVPTERLGVRVSIVERIASAGGHADVRSAPGSGTVVTLRWPDARAVTVPSFASFAAAAEATEADA
jgi:signal transduction histidine kinase